MMSQGGLQTRGESPLMTGAPRVQAEDKKKRTRRRERRLVPGFRGKNKQAGKRRETEKEKGEGRREKEEVRKGEGRREKGRRVKGEEENAKS